MGHMNPEGKYWIVLFIPLSEFIDRVSSPVAWAAFDLPGGNWVWDFGGREGRRLGKDLKCNGPCYL